MQVFTVSQKPEESDPCFVKRRFNVTATRNDSDQPARSGPADLGTSFLVFNVKGRVHPMIWLVVNKPSHSLWKWVLLHL